MKRQIARPALRSLRFPAPSSMQTSPGEEDEGCEGPSFVAEADELHSLVLRIQAAGGAADAVAFTRVAAIVRRPAACPGQPCAALADSLSARAPS